MESHPDWYYTGGFDEWDQLTCDGKLLAEYISVVIMGDVEDIIENSV
jgi:hypothetical protein